MKQFRDTQYYITEKGEVLRNNKKLKPSICSAGYFGVQISQNGKVKRFMIHRLVGECFLDNPDNLPEINHKDGNKLNNEYSNLEWVTKSQNKKHAYLLGLMEVKKGMKSSRAKLKDCDIKYIRSHYVKYSREHNIPNLAKLFGVSQSTIKDILNRKLWNHI